MTETERAPTFANTGVLTRHDLGCRCWPHVSEQDALDAIAAVGLNEYRDGKRAVAAALADAGDRLAVALSTRNHRLMRAAPDGVACAYGQYDDSDHGVEAAELWRDHLIGVARRALTDGADAERAAGEADHG